MAKGFCSVTLGGNLGDDIEIKTVRGDLKIANFSVAVNTNQRVDGEWEEVTSWFRCVAFGKTAEKLEGVAKGSYVAVAGTATIKRWNKDDGSTQEYLETNAKTVDVVVRKEAETSNGTAYNDSEMPF
jgi:single-strand DNA-binding protein